MKAQMIAWFGTSAGIALGIFAWIKVHKMQILKCCKVAIDFINLIRTSVEVTNDDKLSQDEAKQLIDLANQLKADLK